MLGGDQRVPGQFLQNFRHERGRNAIFLGDFVGAARMIFAAMHGQVLDRDQAVVCFFRKLKHLSALSPCVRPPRAYATESVGIEFIGFARESQLSFWNSRGRKTFIFIEIWDHISLLCSLLEKTSKTI